MPRKESPVVSPTLPPPIAPVMTSAIEVLPSEQLPVEKKEVAQSMPTAKETSLEKKEVTPPRITAKPEVTPKPTLSIPDFSISTPYSAPELTGLSNWINSSPLTLASLRGKVVLIDFWTFGCSNCQATTPYIKALYKKYKDRGFIVI